jgi:hypothetical protein
MAGAPGAVKAAAMPTMNKPRVPVDFNEMLDQDTVLLSAHGTKADSHGASIPFSEGLRVAVYMDDVDGDGRPDPLIAEGVAMRNRSLTQWPGVPWVLRVDGSGIRHQSDDPDA